MPLTLVTGPANAEKARHVLDGYRAALAAGSEPLLVVPTLADVDRYRREVAEGGAVFGVEVMRFGWLLDEVARRAGIPGRPLSPLARERVAAAAVARTELRSLAPAAGTRGFARALLALVDELEELRVTPQRWIQALRAWAEQDGVRAAYSAELGRLYAAYRDGLERLGRLDSPLRAAAALDALRENPGLWGPTPVFLYGFDDLSPLQRDAVETLAATAAPVMLSLAYEPGRMAFAGRATTFEDLRAAGVIGEHVALEPRSEHYVAAARSALHHLERRLFELPGDTLFDPDPVDPGDAVTLLHAGGERAELELVGAEILRLVAEDGYALDEIAIVLRAPAASASLVANVLGELGIAWTMDRRTTFGHTSLGRGLVALLRCALPGGRAEDLLAWLRTPGVLRHAGLADRLEAEARRRGVRTASGARALWEAEHWTLDAIDRVSAAVRRGTADLAGQLATELAGLFAAPRRRAAEILAGPEEPDARALAAGRRALDEVVTLAAADRGLAPDAAELATLLDGLEIRLGDRERAGAVTVADPLSLRARRVRALFACGLQEGSFPAAPRPEPFLSDAQRDELLAASGLRLRRREDALAAERYLFYATVSRPTERLYLAWHDATDDGDTAVRSFFLDDVRDLFGPQLWERRRRRSLGAVGWPAGPPTERERQRAEAAAGPRRREPTLAPIGHPDVLTGLRDRPSWSASAIERWAGCPVAWFVERLLRPDGLEPDPEAMRRGALAHSVLEIVLQELERRTGSARLHAASQTTALELMHATLDDLAERPEHHVSADPQRRRALVRRLRADLERYVAHAAAVGSTLEPERFEVSFGGHGDDLPALELASDVRIRGRIDRVDVGAGGDAVVFDYKGASAPPWPQWRKERRYQAALYLLAARDLLGLQAAGGLYQPISAKDFRPRGLLLADVDPGLRTVAGDRQEPEAFAAIVSDVVADVRAAVGQMRDGALEPRPDSCAYEGGCAFPTICRCTPA